MVCLWVCCLVFFFIFVLFELLVGGYYYYYCEDQLDLVFQMGVQMMQLWVNYFVVEIVNGGKQQGLYQCFDNIQWQENVWWQVVGVDQQGVDYLEVIYKVGVDDKQLWLVLDYMLCFMDLCFLIGEMVQDVFFEVVIDQIEQLIVNYFVEGDGDYYQGKFQQFLMCCDVVQQGNGFIFCYVVDDQCCVVILGNQVIDIYKKFFFLFYYFLIIYFVD